MKKLVTVLEKMKVLSAGTENVQLLKNQRHLETIKISQLSKFDSN